MQEVGKAVRFYSKKGVEVNGNLIIRVTLYWERGRRARNAPQARSLINRQFIFALRAHCGRDEHPSGAAPPGTPPPALPVRKLCKNLQTDPTRDR
jgi:hypothetical protein